jgi:hypothetical protein
MEKTLATHYLETASFELRRLKELAEKAIAQVSRDEDLHHALDSESNTISVLVQHLGGNMLSRWTRFLETDGEKPDRDRDAEFEIDPRLARADLLSVWERGWSRLFATLDSLTPSDLARTVRIRGEEHTVPQAIQRQIVHTAYHVGQIVFLAKHVSSDQWKSLSIPKGRSRKSEGTIGSYRKT